MNLLKRSTFSSKKPVEVPTILSNSPAAGHPFVTSAPISDLIRLDELAEVVELAAGEVLVDDATLSHDAYLVLDGRLDVVRGGETVADITPGWFAGEISIRNGRRRNAKLVAAVDTTLYRLARGDFDTLYATSPAIKAHVDATIKVRQAALPESAAA